MFGKLPRWAAGGLFFGAIVLSSAASAAPDARQVADALIAALTASGESKAAYGDATASGDDITITGLTITGEDDDKATLPTVVVSGAAERQPGGFTATRMTIDNGTAESDGSTITWGTAAFENPVVPSAEEIKSKSKLRPFSKVAMAAINISGGELPVPIDIASMDVQIGDVVDGTPSDVVAHVTGLKLPGELITDADVKPIVQALGYQEFLVSLVLDFGLDTGTDSLSLRSLVVEAADVGKLAIVGKFSGVAISKLTNEDTSEEAASKAKLDSLTLRFDNAGIVDRALDMQAKMMGTTREEIVTQLSGVLPLALNVVGNPAFQDKVAAAAAAFLQAPKSFTIKAAPTTPVSFSDIGGAAMGDPSTLPDLLVVDVTAND